MKILTLTSALLTAVGLLSSSAAAAGAPLSFPVARGWLYDRSDKIQAGQARVESRREAQKSVEMLGGPTVTAQVVQVAGQKKIDIDRSFPNPLPIPGLPSSFNIGVHEKMSLNGPRASVAAVWPIYTGGKISAVQEASKYAVDEALAQKRGTVEELDAQLAGYYFGLQLALSVEKLQHDMLLLQDKELARAKKFEKQGLISRLERMSVQVQRDNREREYLKAKDNAKVARVQLARLLHDEEFGALSTPLFVLNEPLETLDKWLDAALVSNPKISEISAKEGQAAQNVRAAEGAYKPQVFAYGTYNFINHYLSLTEPNWIAGLGVSYTLWDAKDRRASLRSADAQLREAQAGRAEAANQIAQATEVAWLKTKNAIEQYRLSASTVTLAKENLTLKSKSFGEGMVTAIDVNEARNQLLQAEIGRRLAAFEFVSNYAVLHAVAGKMSDFMNAYNNHRVTVEK